MRKERAVYSNTVASCQLFAFILIRFYSKMFCHQRRYMWVMPEDMKGRPEQTVQKKTFFFFLSSYHILGVFGFGFGLFYLCLCVCVHLYVFFLSRHSLIFWGVCMWHEVFTPYLGVCIYAWDI